MLKKGIMAAALAVLAAGAFAQKQQVMLDKVVAVVGSSSILYSEVADHARQLTAQRRAEGYTSDRDPMNEALEALMTQKLLFNQAQIDSVKINAGDIASHVEEQVQNMIEAEGSIPRLEAKHHMAIFNIRENMRQRYEEQSYASSMQNEVVSKVAVIPGEVERFYKSIDKDSLPTIAEQYVYAQITRFPKSITQAKQRTRERLLDMRERVITGKAKFENLARMYSQDPGTMMRGGEMDPAPLASLDSSFAAALENMKPGQISEVVESQFGFHIIQMLDKRGSLYHFRHILHGAGRFAIGARRHDCQRLAVDAAEKVAGAHAAASQAKQRIKLPAALGHTGHKPFAKFNIGIPVKMGVGGFSHVCLTNCVGLVRQKAESVGKPPLCFLF